MPIKGNPHFVSSFLSKVVQKLVKKQMYLHMRYMWFKDTIFSIIVKISVFQ